MNVLILGYDGYIGYPLAQHLLERGHRVFGIDDGSRRKRVDNVGGNSITPISNIYERAEALVKKYSKGKFNYLNNLTLGSASPLYIRGVLESFLPNAIFHLAEQPSAPYSMIDPFKSAETQGFNVIGTLHLLWAMKSVCPDAHLIKLGTMGEYGTPNCDIPEGRISENFCGLMKCPMSGLLFPRTPGSFYHLSKVHDTFNIEFACRNWGLRSTDIMQGIVFGLAKDTTDIPNELLTRFDYDEYFGTVINRFCAQALTEYPLTVYGEGGQTRGFLPLKDSIQCLTIALENPPDYGEYRTLNQFENIYSVYSLANAIVSLSRKIGFCTRLEHIPNPRREAEEHYYNPDHQKLFDLGYKPTTDIRTEINNLILQLAPYADKINPKVFAPTTTWQDR